MGKANKYKRIRGEAGRNSGDWRNGGEERWKEGKQREKSGAAELSSSELQHWVLRPCWSTARTTQQQTQRIDSFFLPLLFSDSGLLCPPSLCPLLLIYHLHYG